MGRASTRQNKTPYQLAREELGLSRERAAELLETIPAERIERIILLHDLTVTQRKRALPAAAGRGAAHGAAV